MPNANLSACLPRQSDLFEDNARPDWLKALDLIAEKAGWGRQLPKAPGSDLPSTIGRAVAPRGIRLGRRLSDGPVSPSGLVTIKRMEVVHDQGHAIVNPKPPSVRYAA